MPPLSRLLAGSLIWLLNVPPATAGAPSTVLPGGVELCVNGARYTGKALEAGATGIPITPEVWDNSLAAVAAGSPFLFVSVGEKARFEVFYPEAEFEVGETAFLTITDAPGSDTLGAAGSTRVAVVADCRLLAAGDFTSIAPWTFDGGHDVLTDSDFDWNAGAGDGGLGEFLLLLNRVNGPAGDVDGNKIADNDRAAVAQSFHPLLPCQLEAFVGFYTSEDTSAGYDDFWRVVLQEGESEAISGFSVPGAPNAISTFPDWPVAMTDEGWEVFGGGPLAGEALARGSVDHRNFGHRFAGGMEATISFELYDQFDATVNSALLLDNLGCTSLQLFAANFEDGDLVEWDSTVP